MTQIPPYTFPLSHGIAIINDDSIHVIYKQNRSDVVHHYGSISVTHISPTSSYRHISTKIYNYTPIGKNTFPADNDPLRKSIRAGLLTYIISLSKNGVLLRLLGFPMTGFRRKQNSDAYSDRYRYGFSPYSLFSECTC